MNKDTPCKPKHGSTKPEDYTCPNCGTVVGDRFLDLSGKKIRIKENFCSICGQEIDWEGVGDYL
jgi:predicted RNA-binding Zn-ribbon protein involved in translation (DUF1610 family)